MRTMTGAEVRDRANRWLADSGANLQALGTFLSEFGRLQDIAFTAEKVTQRLRVQMEAAEAETQRLREGVARFRAENARCIKEREDIAAALARVGTALTVEAHYTSGGLGSLACEIVAERGIAAALRAPAHDFQAAENQARGIQTA